MHVLFIIATTATTFYFRQRAQNSQLLRIVSFVVQVHTACARFYSCMLHTIWYRIIRSGLKDYRLGSILRGTFAVQCNAQLQSCSVQYEYEYKYLWMFWVITSYPHSVCTMILNHALWKELLYIAPLATHVLLHYSLSSFSESTCWLPLLCRGRKVLAKPVQSIYEQQNAVVPFYHTHSSSHAVNLSTPNHFPNITIYPTHLAYKVNLILHTIIPSPTITYVS